MCSDSAENVQQQQPEEEAQPHEMTLDEWKALRNQNKPKATFNIRQAGEGEDGAKWSSGREYHKKHEEDEDEEEDDEDEEEEDEVFGIIFPLNFFFFLLNKQHNLFL